VTADTKAAYEPILVKSLLDHLVRTWMVAAEPTLALENDQPTAVAAFGLTHMRTVETIPSMSATLEKYFGAVESYDTVKEPLLAQFASVLERLERTRANMQRELVPSAEIERLKTQGEMILGYQYELTEGQTLLRAAVNEETTLDITLDPKLSAVENANRYFDEYKRARDALERVPERIAAVENDIQYVQQLINDLEMAESRAEIDLVMDEARQAGVIRDTGMRTGGKIVRAEPRHFVSPDNFQVLVGRNARQNDSLTFERAHPEDVWLHARSVAGSHVIIQSAGRPVPDSTLQFGAALAAFYSKARAEGNADVVYTVRKNVHRVRGASAHPGLVTVRDEKVIRVKPHAPEEQG
jgi:predicted ribosome quality control (RQC) complex YloA/Tae2 family protein